MLAMCSSVFSVIRPVSCPTRAQSCYPNGSTTLHIRCHSHRQNNTSTSASGSALAAPGLPGMHIQARQNSPRRSLASNNCISNVPAATHRYTCQFLTRLRGKPPSSEFRKQSFGKLKTKGWRSRRRLAGGNKLSSGWDSYPRLTPAFFWPSTPHDGPPNEARHQLRV